VSLVSRARFQELSNASTSAPSSDCGEVCAATHTTRQSAVAFLKENSDLVDCLELEEAFPQPGTRFWSLSTGAIGGYVN
jgi:hypothetical protein